MENNPNGVSKTPNLNSDTTTPPNPILNSNQGDPSPGGPAVSPSNTVSNPGQQSVFEVIAVASFNQK
jgi:hypothetical protein